MVSSVGNTSCYGGRVESTSRDLRANTSPTSPENMNLINVFNNDIFLIKRGDFFGLVKGYEKELVPCEYSSISYDEETGLAIVQKKSKDENVDLYGLINAENKIVIDFTRNEIKKVCKNIYSENINCKKYILSLTSFWKVENEKVSPLFNGGWYCLKESQGNNYIAEKFDKDKSLGLGVVDIFTGEIKVDFKYSNIEQKKFGVYTATKSQDGKKTLLFLNLMEHKKHFIATIKKPFKKVGNKVCDFISEQLF